MTEMPTPNFARFRTKTPLCSPYRPQFYHSRKQVNSRGSVGQSVTEGSDMHHSPEGGFKQHHNLPYPGEPKESRSLPSCPREKMAMTKLGIPDNRGPHAGGCRVAAITLPQSR